MVRVIQKIPFQLQPRHILFYYTAFYPVYPYVTVLRNTQQNTNSKPWDIRFRSKPETAVMRTSETLKPNRTVDTAQVWFVCDWVWYRITYHDISWYPIPHIMRCRKVRHIDMSYIFQILEPMSRYHECYYWQQRLLALNVESSCM